MTYITDNHEYFFKIDTTIKKIRNSLQRSFQRAGLNLTFDQWVLLDNIYRDQGISQNGLAEVTFKDPPTVTRIVDLLEKKDLVKRISVASDRRKFNLFLTENGEELHERALPIVVNMKACGWENLSEDDYRNFVRMIDVIFENCA